MLKKKKLWPIMNTNDWMNELFKKFLFFFL